MMYLDGHGGGGYGVHHGGGGDGGGDGGGSGGGGRGDIAGAAVGRRGRGRGRGDVALRRRVDAEGRHEFRSVDIQGGELALDGLVLRRRRTDDVAVRVRLLFPRVWCYAVRHINQLFRRTHSRLAKLNG